MELQSLWLTATEDPPLKVMLHITQLLIRSSLLTKGQFSRRFRRFPFVSRFWRMFLILLNIFSFQKILLLSFLSLSELPSALSIRSRSTLISSSLEWIQDSRVVVFQVPLVYILAFKELGLQPLTLFWPKSTPCVLSIVELLSWSLVIRELTC